jgi:hypothetical protein
VFRPLSVSVFVRGLLASVPEMARAAWLASASQHVMHAVMHVVHTDVRCAWTCCLCLCSYFSMVWLVLLLLHSLCATVVVTVAGAAYAYAYAYACDVDDAGVPSACVGDVVQLDRTSRAVGGDGGATVARTLARQVSASACAWIGFARGVSMVLRERLVSIVDE